MTTAAKPAQPKPAQPKPAQPKPAQPKPPARPRLSDAQVDRVVALLRPHRHLLVEQTTPDARSTA